MLYLISLSGFTSSIANRSMDPLVSSIAAEFGLPLATAALVITFFALPYSVGQPILGPLGDYYGKGRVLRACLWVLTISLVFVAWSPNFEVLVAARFVGGIASGGLMPVALAMIADRYPPEMRQLAISRGVAALQTGFLLAASLSGLLAVVFNWRGIFLLALALAATNAILVTVFVREPPAPKKHIRLSHIIDGYRPIFHNPRAWVCFSAVFLEGLVLNGCFPFIAPLMTERGLGGPREAGFIITGVGLGALVFTLLVKRLLQIMPRYRLMMAGGGLALMGPLALSFPLTWPVLAMFFTLTGFGYMMVHNSIQAEVSEIAPQSRASAFAMHSCSLFVGTALGPIYFASGMAAFGASQVLMVNAAVMLLIGPTISLLLTQLPKSPQPQNA
jgi:predicted MFS family arabinose efflux permease